MVLTFCPNISQDELRSSRKRETLDACMELTPSMNCWPISSQGHKAVKRTARAVPAKIAAYKGFTFRPRVKTVTEKLVLVLYVAYA